MGDVILIGLRRDEVDLKVNVPLARMLPESVEALAAVAYTAHAEFAWRCLGEPILPAWGRQTPEVRELWMRYITAATGAPRAGPDPRAVELSTLRRYRLIAGIVEALTAVA